MIEPRAIRFVRIVLLAASGAVRNLEELATLCFVSRRTLQRDLQELRGLQIDVRHEEGQITLSRATRELIRTWMGVEAGTAEAEAV